jgi:hypothetical protein
MDLEWQLTDPSIYKEPTMIRDVTSVLYGFYPDDYVMSPNSEPVVPSAVTEAELAAMPAPMTEARLAPMPEARLAPMPEARLAPMPEARPAPMPEARLAPMPEARLAPMPEARLAPMPAPVSDLELCQGLSQPTRSHVKVPDDRNWRKWYNPEFIYKEKSAETKKLMEDWKGYFIKKANKRKRDEAETIPTTAMYVVKPETTIEYESEWSPWFDKECEAINWWANKGGKPRVLIPDKNGFLATCLDYKKEKKTVAEINEFRNNKLDAKRVANVNSMNINSIICNRFVGYEDINDPLTARFCVHYLKRIS